MLRNAPTAFALSPRAVEDGDDVIVNSLTFARRHLGMEVAYLARVLDGLLIFEAVVAPGFEDIVCVGKSVPITSTLAQHVIDGSLPELIAETEDHPLIKTLDVMKIVPVRSHLSIPIHRPDGALYGVFCCFDREPRPTLNARDLEVLRAFASLSSDQINMRLAREVEASKKRAAIEGILAHRSLEIALQPIKKLQNQQIAGFEALCRFSPEPYRPPNLWFEDAAEVGMQVALEVYVIEIALAVLPDLPSSCYLAVNTSPETLATGQLSDIIEQADGRRVIVEITEHAAVEDLDVLLMEIDRLRDLGVRIAVDDAGAGYSGLQQIIALRPDVIKLDISLTQDVDKDVARRALASAMVQFADDTNACVVAEGIETEAEMRTLKNLGVELGQGYHLGRPALSRDVLQRARPA